MKITPVEYFTGLAHKAKVTSPFGPRKDPLGSSKMVQHNGVDFGGVSRGHPWTSPYPGVVTHLGAHGGRGKVAVVKIEGTNVLQIMQHLDDYRCRIGDQIEPGYPIGTNGTSGDVTGPHLHYELRIDNGSPLGNPVWGDPALFTREGVTGMVKTYTVVKGDTLGSISVRFGISIAQLRTWNNRTPEQDRSLAIGTVLFVADPKAGNSGIGQEAINQLTARVKILEDALARVKSVL